MNHIKRLVRDEKLLDKIWKLIIFNEIAIESDHYESEHEQEYYEESEQETDHEDDIAQENDDQTNNGYKMVNGRIYAMKGNKKILYNSEMDGEPHIHIIPDDHVCDAWCIIPNRHNIWDDENYPVLCKGECEMIASPYHICNDMCLSGRHIYLPKFVPEEPKYTDFMDTETVAKESKNKCIIM
uniref:Uncharacterized protein n=1 Tax=Acrobeloides nanus TaxID=290746 RepID=A0A914DZD4_9BILA